MLGKWVAAARFAAGQIGVVVGGGGTLERDEEDAIGWCAAEPWRRMVSGREIELLAVGECSSSADASLSPLCSPRATSPGAEVHAGLAAPYW